jgi:hypothetical protein
LENIKVVEANVEISEKEIEVKISVFVEIRNKCTEAVSVLCGVNDVNLQPSQKAVICYKLLLFYFIIHLFLLLVL